MANRLESIRYSIHSGEATEKALLAAELAGVAAYAMIATTVDYIADLIGSQLRILDQETISYSDTHGDNQSQE